MENAKKCFKWWSEYMILCNRCYMNHVSNPLKRGNKVINKEILEATEIGITKTEMETEEINLFNNFGLVEAIRSMAKILHNREVKEKQKPIYNFDELRELLENQDSNLGCFFEQLYLAARPSDRSSQTMEHMKKIIVFICYLLASLNNTQINAFKKKKKILETHKEYVRDDLIEHLNNALILNIDDYHNIHIQQQPCTTATSLPTHMATIVANLCLTLAIPRSQVLNPKIVDGELIIRNIDKRFIINLDSLQTVYKQEPMLKYLSKFAVPVIADWPGQFYICKAIAQKVLLDNRNVPEFGTAFLPMMGPLHVSLNGRELVFKKNSCLFNNIYKSVFGIRKNLVPLVLDVYAIHHREENWLAYEEACIRCWSDLFFQFDRKNYKRAPLIIIRRRTSKPSMGEQLRIAAHTTYQQRHNNDFQKEFVRSSNNIDTYKLSSLGYEITDRHLPRGFVTSRKPNYLQNEIKKNTDALLKSLTKDLGENLSKEEIEEDNEDSNEIHEISDDGMVERKFENAKKIFFEMHKINIINK
ncbi:hypothetical protein C2G38_2199672 [Gigaspora rosea]|uniref:Uncharacterized protein n=1 Tax=Gigaspora rosea TaxID=44941 RepID=A0A397UT63_9GLOM|nr:hypothetical protein C2G38_2199672 [Gigaspora rosea]